MNFIKGNELYNQGEFELAIQEYNKSVKEGLEVETSYYNMGVAYIKLEDYDNAISCFRSAISFKEKNKHFYNLGVCYEHKNDYGSALFNFILASKLDEDDEDTKKAIKWIMDKIKEDQK